MTGLQNNNNTGNEKDFMLKVFIKAFTSTPGTWKFDQENIIRNKWTECLLHSLIEQIHNYTDMHTNIHKIKSTSHLICNSPSSGWMPKSPDASRGMLPNQPHALCKNILWTRKHKLADTFWKNQTIWSPWRL